MEKDVQLSWLAGLLEGEGSFMFNAPSPVIALQMTDKDVVQRVAQMLDDAKLCGPYTYRGNNVKQVWACRMQGRDAVPWMAALYPLMGERRKQQIESAIEKWWTYQPKPREKKFKGTPFKREKSWATCHPDRRPVGGGLCQMCYMRQWREGITFGHHPKGIPDAVIEDA